jgi:hypothetical protein
MTTTTIKTTYFRPFVIGCTAYYTSALMASFLAFLGGYFLMFRAELFYG